MTSQYQLKLRSKEKNKIYQFGSADGINSKNNFRREEILLADEVLVEKTDKVLIIQSGFGFLGTVLGNKAQKVTMYETSARATEFSKTNTENNGIENFEVSNKPEIADIEGVFDKIIYAPENYAPTKLVKKRLAQSAKKLTPKGEIHIAGKKKTGLKRYKNFLKDYSEQEKIGKRNGIKAYRFSKFTETPEINIEKNFSAKLNDAELNFKTSEGLFSSGKLDEGTKTLLNNIETKNPDKILDLACGYGAITAFLAQKQDANFFLTDDNARATKYARKNMERNNVENYQIKTADCLDAFEHKKFDLIISNPPTHQGKGITKKMFSQAAKALEKRGELWLVYNQNMNYEDKLRQKFDSVEIVAEKNNFAVCKAEK